MNTDIVVTWVDGSDSTHAAKRAEQLKKAALHVPEEGYDESRFVPHGEIRYCLRSIYNYCPWYGRVFLVTDNQFPDSIDRKEAEKYNIYQVDHADIFYGYEQYLPTFNSMSIESMLWRLPGLSPQFLYINDDMFFSRMVPESLFFRNEAPIIRATWRKRWPKRPSLFRKGMVNAAELINAPGDMCLEPTHYPVPASVDAFDRLNRYTNGRLLENAKEPFRTESQFQPMSALYSFLHFHEGHPVRKHEPNFGFLFPQGNVNYRSLHYRLKARLFRMHVFYCACLNDFQYANEVAAKLIDSISSVTGPPAPFEK